MSLQLFSLFDRELNTLADKKKLITTLNAHSYNLALQDDKFRKALTKSHVLIPDGISVVLALKLLTGKKINKIAGADLFYYEMNKIQQSGGKVFFLGSSEETLEKIRERAAIEYPNVEVYSYSPPFKAKFSENENAEMITRINEVNPDVLFVGMTAPKQEKWAYEHFSELKTKHVCCIGAVFDFYAGTVKRAPEWLINLGLEWLCRLIREPKRMWRRYLIGNAKFVFYIMKEKFTSNNTDRVRIAHKTY